MLDAVSRALTLHREDLAHPQHNLSSLRSVEERIRVSQATVYVVTLGEGRRMERVRNLLGRTVERALDAVRGDLANRYFIGYRPSNPALDGTWRQIEVRTPDRRHVIRAREGYLASPSPD